MIALDFKKVMVLAMGLFFGSFAFAQNSDSHIEPFAPDSSFRSWSVGGGIGGLSLYTVFLGSPDFTTQVPKIGYSVYVKKQFIPTFGLEADVLFGELQGKFAVAPPNTNRPFIKFDTKINWSAALSANFVILNTNWRASQSHLQVYSTLGGGMISFTPTLYDYSGTKFSYKSSSAITIPIGLGLKYSITSGINLDVGYQVNFVDAGNVDGYAYGGRNDKFSYTHVGLEFAIGKGKKPQLSGHNAEPAMRTEYESGINLLQTQVFRLKLKADSIQGQLDRQRVQTARLEAVVTSTNKDSDGDGVPDKFDKCPNTPAGVRVDGSGCPLPKTVLTPEDSKVVDNVIKSLVFELKKSTIVPTSYPSLDLLAQLMMSKKLKLRLDGYTDNTGPDWRNLALSKSRALAVKNYLVKKGVNTANITATGYGNLNPVVSNDTLEGRKKNRRVEFILY